MFASYHAGGRATNYRVKEDRRLDNHHYFRLRDPDYGDGFVRICSYPPFQTRVWMNARGYIGGELRRRGIDYRHVLPATTELLLPQSLGSLRHGSPTGSVCV